MRISSWKMLWALGGAALVAVTAGCADTSAKVVSNAQTNLLVAPPVAPINGYCPVYTAKKVTPSVEPRRYKGQLIGFSSEQAKRMWIRWPVMRKNQFLNRQLAIRNGAGTTVIGADKSWQQPVHPVSQSQMQVLSPTLQH